MLTPEEQENEARCEVVNDAVYRLSLQLEALEDMIADRFGIDPEACTGEQVATVCRVGRLVAEAVELAGTIATAPEAAPAPEAEAWERLSGSGAECATIAGRACRVVYVAPVRGFPESSAYAVAVDGVLRCYRPDADSARTRAAEIARGAY